MKQITRYSLLLLGCLIIASACLAHGRSTIILIRHAEKQTKSADPALSKAGEKRAAQLQVIFKEYKPDLFYSTNTRRTRQTVETWSKASGKDIITYDAATQDQLAQQLLHLMSKTVVVVGHSNTIPQLANLLLGTTTYSDMDDNEYNKDWIITVEHGHAQ